MHLRSTRMFLVVVALLAYSTATAASVRPDCTQFVRNLKVGMSGNDVKELQRVLNATNQTMVATIGPGSPGNEGSYFGQKTKIALAKFQDLYANETLAPAGLKRGSGYFGELTRKKLIAVCQASTVGSSSSSRVPRTVTSRPSTHATTPALVPAKPLPAGALTAFSLAGKSTDPLEFFYPSDYVVKPGAKVGIFGRGFTTTGNVVHIGELAIGNLSPDEFGVLNVSIPKNATKGKFDLWVTNAKGESKKKFLVIKDPATAQPVITSYTPRSGLLGTMVKVTGTGFSASNDIYLSNHLIRGVPSTDGRSLTFKMSSPEIPNATDGYDIKGVDRSLPYWFYIVNENGMSGNGVFTVKI